MTAKNKFLTVRIDKYQHEDLKRLAKLDNRTLANYIRQVFRLHIERVKNQ